MKYKLAIFDIDGTLLSYSSNQIDLRIKKWFKQLNDNNIITVLATGRDYISIGNVYETLKPNYFIGANGGFVDKMIDDEPNNIFNCPIDLLEFEKYYNMLLLKNEELVVNILLSDKQHVFARDFSHLDNHWFWKDHKLKFRKLDDYKNLIDEETFSLITINTIDTQLIEKSKEYFKNTNSKLQVQASWSNGFFVSLKDVNKYSTIMKLANKLNISSSEIIAFGDGNNDIEMIKNVGHGVAMDNANSELKKVADAITDSVENSGVYKYLLKINLLK